jgi:hypothetical protein
MRTRPLDCDVPVHIVFFKYCYRPSGDQEFAAVRGKRQQPRGDLSAEHGEARGAFEGAYVRRERFDTQRHTAVTMETRGLLAEWDAENNRLIVFGAAKMRFAARHINRSRTMQRRSSGCRRNGVP